MERTLYGTLEVRSVDDELRIIEGIATSASVDSHDTVVEPSGAVYRLPMPLFFHDGGEHGPKFPKSRNPIGNVIAAEVRNGKMWFRAQVPKVSDDGTEGGRSVKHRVDAAWSDIKHGLVRGTSIEFIPIEPRNNYAKRWTKWDWRGLAIVPVPSNLDATVLTVRSISEAYIAASGDSQKSPGVSGQLNNKPRPKMTIQEQITQFENTRAAKVAARDSLLEASGAEGTTLDETQAETFDTLDTEIRSIDSHLVRLNSAKTESVTRATPVVATSTATASQTRAGVSVVTIKPNEAPGLGYARFVMSMMNGKGNPDLAASYAKRTWGDAANEVVTHIHTRTAVAAGTTVETNWALPLVQTNYVNEFLELLRPKTLLGRIPGLRHVPFNVSMPAQTGGGTYAWVGEGKAKPVTKPQYASVTLGKAKAAGIIVLTKELVKLSTPSAQEAVRDEMLKGIQQFLDTQFVDASIAAVSNVNPASITNGVTGTAASGTDVADARSDIGARIQAYAAANYGLSGLVILMSESQAFALGLMLNAQGQPAFPGLGVEGGSILGIPVVTSETVGAQIIFAHAPSIFIADEGGIEIDASEEASIQMDSAPTDPPDGNSVLTSFWQHNLVGLRVERMITWGKARSTAVDRITSAAYVA